MVRPLVVLKFRVPFATVKVTFSMPPYESTSETVTALLVAAEKTNAVFWFTVCKDGNDSCHMKCEKYHISGGTEWEEGLHPDDLYKLIKSSKDLAIEKSKLL